MNFYAKENMFDVEKCCRMAEFVIGRSDCGIRVTIVFILFWKEFGRSHLPNSIISEFNTLNGYSKIKYWNEINSDCSL